MYIDTHTHLFLEQFEEDIKETMDRAKAEGVLKCFLPNIDASTISPLKALAAQFPEQCFPMMGLHPCSVKEDWKQQMQTIENELRKGKYYAVGEAGLDYYWDTSFKAAQQEALRYQVSLALELDLPIVLHTRDSFDDNLRIMQEMQDGRLRGVFHCFTGSPEEAVQVIDLGFYLGIGGVVTFKNSGLDKTLEQVPLQSLVLETDSPYLAPVPFRGKRNESSYIPYIARKLAEIKDMPVETIASETSRNSMKLFSIKNGGN
ncbi:MAG: TatD family hydrolase [Bacteroidia bacterium]